jgi:hypothetical protein
MTQPQPFYVEITIGDNTGRIAFLPSAVCKRCGQLARPAFDPGDGWQCRSCIADAATEAQAALTPDAAARYSALARGLVQAIDDTPGAPEAIRAGSSRQTEQQPDRARAHPPGRGLHLQRRL